MNVENFVPKEREARAALTGFQGSVQLHRY